MLLAGTQTGFFSQYADQPMVEKEIISKQKQSLNNASFSGGNNDPTKEAKVSGAKNGSDMNQPGQRNTHAQESETETEKTRQDQLNQNNSSVEECSGSGDNGPRDHPLRKELDKAARSGAADHFDNMAQAVKEKEGDGKKNNKDSGSSEPDKQKQAKDKENNSQSKADKKNAAEGSHVDKSEDSKMAADLPASGEADGKAKPEQDIAKKSYAQAASDSNKKPPRGRGTVIYLISL